MGCKWPEGIFVESKAVCPSTVCLLHKEVEDLEEVGVDSATPPE